MRRAVSLPRALSKLGLCSRKQAFDYIAGGRVQVNGSVSKDTTQRVSLEADRISVDGTPAIADREPIVIALHKPVGYVTTRTDPQGRPTVYDLLPELDRFVFPVGRLDRETSGLLILTDDHRLGEALTNPESHIPKTYEVALHRPLDEFQLATLRGGLDIGKGEVTRPCEVVVLRDSAEGFLLKMTLKEGRNRQIRRMLSAVGESVAELVRVAVGGLRLGTLPVGAHRVLSPIERVRLLGTDVSES